MKRTLQVFNFSVRNVTEDSVDIHVDGDIVDVSTQELLKAWFGDESSVSFKSFRDQINAVDAKVYNVYINSNGGIVTDAMAMHDFLEELESKGKTVNRIGRGIIASAATYLLMGKNSSMTKNSWFMIHNVSGGVWGDVNMIENYAVTLRKFNDRIRDFYSEKTNQRKEVITKMMNAETWMSADEAKEKGFVANIVGAQSFTNQISKEDWPYSNTAVLNAYNNAVKLPQDNENNSVTQKLEEMKQFWQNLSKEIMNAIKGVKAPENNDHSALMNGIGEAVSKVFENQSEAFEKALNEHQGEKVIDFTKDENVKKAFDEAVANAVKDAVDFSKEGPAKTAIDNAVKEYSNKITDLEREIINLKGRQTTNKQEDEADGRVRMKGSYS
jgi:ATP-dependent Clp protease protease subunit